MNENLLEDFLDWLEKKDKFGLWKAYSDLDFLRRNIIEYLVVVQCERMHHQIENIIKKMRS